MMRLRAALIFLSAAVPHFCLAEETPDDPLALATSEGELLSQAEILTRRIEKGTDGPSEKEALARVWLEWGDVRAAQSALRGHPAPPAELTAVIGAAAAKSPTEAASLLEAHLDAEPESPAALEALLAIYQKESRYADLADALQDSPLIESHPEWLLERARARRSAGNFDRALADFSELQARAPGERFVLAEAPAFERLARAAPKIRQAQARLTTTPDDLATLVELAWWQRYAGLDGVGLTARTALKAHPDSMAARISAALSSGLPSWQTEDELGVRTTSVPDLPLLVSLVGYDEAVARGVEGSLTRRAEFLLNSAGQPRLAASDARAAIKKNPNDTRAALTQIIALASNDRVSEAAAAFFALEKSGAPARETAEAARQIAQMHWRRGSLHAALQMADRSLAARKTPEAYRIRAGMHQQLGEPERAAEDAAAATRLENRR